MEDSREERFIALLNRYRNFIFKVAGLYCSNTEDQKDLYQEIILQLWKAYPKYKPEYATISTWMYRIALNVSISFLRKESKRKTKKAQYALQSDLWYPEDAYKDERLILLYQFIEALKPIEKALIVLHLEGCKNAEIAEIIGISLSNVSTRIHRIKEKLSTNFKTLKHF